MQDYGAFSASSYPFLQPQDDYLQKLLSLDQTGSYPGLTTVQGASSPENDSASACPESSAGNQARSLPPPPPANEKRKGDTKAGAIKDRRASGGSANGVHTHEDDGSEDDGKGNKGKTSEKRKLQNRQAQRNFRERKEKHLKELEDRVFSLEQQTTEQGSENAALKQLLERLQSENERLKVFESAFSFSYAKDVAPSGAMPVSSSFKPPTPPTAQDEVDDITSFPLGSFNSISGNSSFSGASNTGASPAFMGGNLFGSNASAFGLPQSSASFTNSPPVFDDSLFLNTLGGGSGASPASTVAGGSTSGSSAHVPTPPDTSDLFAAYRDPNFGVPTLNSLSDFDTLFGSGSGLDDLSAFIASPTPPAPVTSTSTPPALPTTVNFNDCPYGPKTQDGKYEFDVDGLCAEMKLKATCQEAARQALRSAMKEDADRVAAAYPGQ